MMPRCEAFNVVRLGICDRVLRADGGCDDEEYHGDEFVERRQADE